MSTEQNISNRKLYREEIASILKPAIENDYHEASIILPDIV